jgi:hypothetical protein
MSEDKISVQDTYDFSKNITDISLSVAYIHGLEKLMTYFFMNMEDPSILKPMFEKFESYIKGELDIQKNPFSEEEANLYTIFSLQQLLKAKAYQQGLNIKVDATIDKKLIEELLQATVDGNKEKFTSVNNEMMNSINEQLS